MYVMHVETVEHRSRPTWPAASQLPYARRAALPLSMTSAAYRSLAHSEAGGGLMNVETVEHRSRPIWPAALQLPYAWRAAPLLSAAASPTWSAPTPAARLAILSLLRGRLAVHVKFRR